MTQNLTDSNNVRLLIWHAHACMGPSFIPSKKFRFRYTSPEIICFGEKGQTYAIYLPSGGNKTIDLESNMQTFTVKWFNPRTDGSLQNGSVYQKKFDDQSAAHFVNAINFIHNGQPKVVIEKPIPGEVDSVLIVGAN